MKQAAAGGGVKVVGQQWSEIVAGRCGRGWQVAGQSEYRRKAVVRQVRDVQERLVFVSISRTAMKVRVSSNLLR